MSAISEKEKEVEISRIKHSILEAELKKIKKEEEITRIEENIEKFRELLATKEQ